MDIKLFHFMGETNMNELKIWFRDLFHWRGVAASKLSYQAEEQPYEPAGRRWQQIPKEQLSDAIQVIRELIEEAISLPWTTEAFHQLCFFIEYVSLHEVCSDLNKADEMLYYSNFEYHDQFRMNIRRTLSGLQIGKLTKTKEN